MWWNIWLLAIKVRCLDCLLCGFCISTVLIFQPVRLGLLWLKLLKDQYSNSSNLANLYSQFSWNPLCANVYHLTGKGHNSNAFLEVGCMCTWPHKLTVVEYYMQINNCSDRMFNSNSFVPTVTEFLAVSYETCTYLIKLHTVISQPLSTFTLISFWSSTVSWKFLPITALQWMLFCICHDWII